MQVVLARPGRLRTALLWRPEWPVALLALAAWVAVVVVALWPPGSDIHAAHAPHNSSSHGSFAIALVMWGAMSAAMMLPVALPAIRYLALNSLRARRSRVVALYTSGYVAVWLAFGSAALLVERYLTNVLGADRSLVLAVTLFAASAWQVSGWKRRALFQCHRTVPLPPFGLRADAACLRFALVQSARCLRSCWALMAVMAVTGHAGPAALGVMAGLAALIALEELSEDGTQVLHPSAGVLALAAGLAVSGLFDA